jgi:hypothetical protein
VSDVAPYVDVDFGGGAADLVALLRRPDADVAGAIRLLGALGDDGVHSVAEAWTDLPPRSRRYAARLLADRAHLSAARDVLRVAVADAEPSVRLIATRALATTPEGRTALAQALATQPADVGDPIAAILARLDPQRLISTAIPMFLTEAGRRPAMRRALAVSVTAAGSEAVRELQARIPQTPMLARVALVEALIDTVHGAPLAQAELAELVSGSEGFEPRFRLARASAAARSPVSGVVIDWLATLLTAEEWMLREVAVVALARSGAGPRARGALADPYPRVRMAAVLGLRGDDESAVQRATLARRDRWPMVRATAVRSVDGTRLRPVVRAAVDDPSHSVRVAAIETLARLRDGPARAVVRARLSDVDEWPDVRAAAVDYARTVCDHEAGEILLHVVRRGLAGDASTDEVALAVRAAPLLRVMGVEGAADVLAAATAETAPPALRRAVAAGATDHGCGRSPSQKVESSPSTLLRSPR